MKDPRIDVQNEGAKTVLHFIYPEGASMVDAEGKIFVCWFSLTQENANVRVKTHSLIVTSTKT